MTRRLLALLALALLLLIAAGASTALAAGGDTSLDDNISPETQLHGLADHWPSNRFGLDHHDGEIVKHAKTTPFGPTGTPLDILPNPLGGVADSTIKKAPSGIDFDAAGASMKHTIADMIWDGVRYGVGLINSLLVFALSLDLLSGHDSLLGPVADGAGRLFHEMRGGWMQAALVGLGLYVLVFAVIRRRITQTFGKVAVSFLMVSCALLVLTQWQWTIGATSKYTNEASLAIIGTVNGDSNRDAKVGASDALFDALIVNPFLVLNFGGLEHCVDKHGNSVKPKSDDCARGGTLIDNRKRYLKRWLDAGPANSPPRQLEYEAIRDAKIPDATAIRDAGLPPTYFDGYKPTKADTPAVDIQQRDLAGDRLIITALVAFGTLGAGLLIGGLAVGIILFKIIAIGLFAVTAVVAVAALFPGAGHRTFWSWAERLILALTLNVWYSLVLAIVLLISRGLTAAGPQYGWKLTFFLLAMFWWLVFLLRKHAVRFVLRSLPGNSGAGHRDRDWGDVARSWHYKSKMLLPAAAGVGSGVGAVLRAGPSIVHNAAEGGHMATDKIKDYATKGHSTRLGADAARNAQALQELETEHQANVERHRTEQRRRDDRTALQTRQRAATNSAIPDEVLKSMDLPSSALTPAEKRKLHKLQQDAMPQDDFEALGRTIADVEQRRKDTDGQPFSTDQIRERAQRIREREEVSEDLAGRTERYTNSGYADLFGDDDELLGPHADLPPTQRPRARVDGRRRVRSPRRPRSWSPRRRNHRRDAD